MRTGSLRVELFPFCAQHRAFSQKQVTASAKAWWYPAPPPYYYYPPGYGYGAGLAFASGVFWGAAIAGGIGWGKERSQKGLFTDPVYYSPPAMAVAGGASYATIDDFKGKRVGTISGYLWEKAIKATPGIAQAKTYPDAETMFSDLNNGRLDIGFIDPLLIPYEAKKNPSAKFKISYFKEPTEAQVAATPDLINYRQLQISFYLAKDAPKLEAALNTEIRKMYANGKLSALITKYGGDPSQFLKPAPYQSKLRTGVDREADWNPPSI